MGAIRGYPLMQAKKVLRRRANAGLFPELALCGLNQCFIGLEVARRLVPQRFSVNRFFNNEEFAFRVNHAGDGDVRLKH